MENIKIEIQYFNGCPNSETTLNMVKKFVIESKLQIKFSEVLIETQSAAEEYKFRGSPTILINGKDIDGLEESKTPSLSCRYYKSGLPTKEDLEKFVNSLIKNMEIIS